MKKLLFCLLFAITLNSIGCNSQKDTSKKAEGTDTSTEQIESTDTSAEQIESTGTSAEQEHVMNNISKNSYLIMNGNTGERITVNEPSKIDELESLLDQIELQEKDDTIYYGYSYFVTAIDETGERLYSFCITENFLQSGESGYYIENSEDLLSFLDGLYR